jgi:multiple sugar transport system ATP-binding protein
MSISDIIVVMKLGVLQQIGKPQDIYDDPTNLFVAKFLGTPPINVFNGKVEDGKLFIGEDYLFDVHGVEDQEVTVAIRPEGFNVDADGGLVCVRKNIEVMGRDVSIVSTHDAAQSPIIRSIVDSDTPIDLASPTVRFSLKPHKVFLFNKETEERIYFEV